MYAMTTPCEHPYWKGVKTFACAGITLRFSKNVILQLLWIYLLIPAKEVAGSWYYQSCMSRLFNGGGGDMIITHDTLALIIRDNPTPRTCSNLFQYGPHCTIPAGKRICSTVRILLECFRTMFNKQVLIFCRSTCWSGHFRFAVAIAAYVTICINSHHSNA